MGQIPQDGEDGQNVAFFWSSAVTKRFDFLNFSTVLKRFWPGHSKNVIVLVLAHLEPQLELEREFTHFLSHFLQAWIIWKQPFDALIGSVIWDMDGQGKGEQKNSNTYI